MAWAVARFAMSHIPAPAEYHWLPELGIVCLTSLVWLGVVAVLSKVLQLHQLQNEASQAWAKVRDKLGKQSA